jgi:hypothetical protein
VHILIEVGCRLFIEENVTVKLPRRQFLQVAASAAARPAAGPTFLHVLLANGYRSGSANHSSSRTGWEHPAISPLRLP